VFAMIGDVRLAMSMPSESIGLSKCKAGGQCADLCVQPNLCFPRRAHNKMTEPNHAVPQQTRPKSENVLLGEMSGIYNELMSQRAISGKALSRKQSIPRLIRIICQIFDVHGRDGQSSHGASDTDIHPDGLSGAKLRCWLLLVAGFSGRAGQYEFQHCAINVCDAGWVHGDRRCAVWRASAD